MQMRRVYKQGNSLVISLPGWMLEQIKVEQGDMVTMEVMKGQYIKLTKSQRDLFGGEDKEDKEDNVV